MNDLTIIPTPAFGDAPVTTLVWKGRPVWTAAQVSDLLDYADSLAVQQGVRVKWSDEFIEGTDFEIVEGEDLAPFKTIGVVGKNAPSVMLLTEPGFNLAILKSRQPVAVKLRRWLAEEVLPSIRRTGRYAVRGELPKLTGSSSSGPQTNAEDRRVGRDGRVVDVSGLRARGEELFHDMMNDDNTIRLIAASLEDEPGTSVEYQATLAALPLRLVAPFKARVDGARTRLRRARGW